jgi:hypothetical protein
MHVTAVDVAVDHALDTLGASLHLEETELQSHTALVLSGLSDPGVVESLGIYLVALLAGVVRTNLALSTVLLEQTPDGHAQLVTDVEARLTPPKGASVGVVANFNANVRDPWIAEGVGHALLAVRGRIETACLSGAVAAMTVPHAKPSQQGFDLFAIYAEDGLPAMALGEAKATQGNGSGRLTEATSFFRAVEDGEREVDIRMQVVSLFESLEPDLQDKLSAGFWRERASYLPFVAYGDHVDPATERPALAAIGRPASYKRVIHCRPTDYAAFFDAVAAAMRDAVNDISPS